MKYQKQNTISGSWIKSSDLVGIKKATIVSETTSQPSQFQDKKGNVKNQDVCKVRFEGKDDVYNLSLNKTTLNGLIDAFGEESADWMNQPLSVETEKVRVAGVARVAVYLIPEGFEKVDNDEGFAEIQKMGLERVLRTDDIPVVNEDEEIPSDL